MARFQEWIPVIVMLAVCFAMAVLNILFKKILDEGTNHLVIITYRLTAAAIFLAPIAFLFERKGRVKLTTSILCYIFFSALIGAILFQYLFLLGNLFTSAVFSSAFSSLTPVFTFLLAIPLGLESVNLKTKHGVAKVMGSLICISGTVLLILYRGLPLNKATYRGKSIYHNDNLSTASKFISKERWIIGSILLVLSILCLSGWFHIQSKIGKKYPHKFSSTALMSVFGALQSAILCFSIHRDPTTWILSGKLQICTVLFAGIVVSGLCYVGMSWCVEQRGPVFTAAFSPFVPIFVTLMDFAFFHEQIYLGSVIGSIIVICGLYTLLWGKNGDSPEHSSKAADAVEHNGSSANATNVTQVTSTS